MASTAIWITGPLLLSILAEWTCGMGKGKCIGGRKGAKHYKNSSKKLQAGRLYANDVQKGTQNWSPLLETRIDCELMGAKGKSCYQWVPEPSVTLIQSLYPVIVKFTHVRINWNRLSWQFTHSRFVSTCKVRWGRHHCCPSRTGKLRSSKVWPLVKSGLVGITYRSQVSHLLKNNLPFWAMVLSHSQTFLWADSLEVKVLSEKT